MPDHPERSKALLGLGRSHLALENNRLALTYFDELIGSEQGDMQLAALFYAWQTAVSANDLDLAYRYFESISDQQEFDRESQIASLPQYLLRELPKRYIKEASQLERWDPEAALSLYDQAQTVADILKQSKERQRAREGLLRCHRLLLDYAGMADSHLILAEEQRFNNETRCWHVLQAAWLHRYLHNWDTAKDLYRRCQEQGRFFRGLCAFWLGELAWRQDDIDQATAIWQEALDKNHFEANRIFRHSDMKYLLELCVNAEVPELPSKIDTMVDFHVSYIFRINQPWDRRPWGHGAGDILKTWPMMLGEAEIQTNCRSISPRQY